MLSGGILKRVASSDQVASIAIIWGGAFSSLEVIRLRPIGSSARAVNFGTCKYVHQQVAASKTVVPKCKVSPFGAE